MLVELLLRAVFGVFDHCGGVSAASAVLIQVEAFIAGLPLSLACAAYIVRT